METKIQLKTNPRPFVPAALLEKLGFSFGFEIANIALLG
jgi:hypothetical protein